MSESEAVELNHVAALVIRADDLAPSDTVAISKLSLEKMTKVTPTPFSPICLGLPTLFVPNGLSNLASESRGKPMPLSEKIILPSSALISICAHEADQFP